MHGIPQKVEQYNTNKYNTNNKLNNNNNYLW